MFQTHKRHLIFKYVSHSDGQTLGDFIILDYSCCSLFTDRGRSDGRFFYPSMYGPLPTLYVVAYSRLNVKAHLDTCNST